MMASLCNALGPASWIILLMVLSSPCLLVKGQVCTSSEGGEAECRTSISPEIDDLKVFQKSIQTLLDSLHAEGGFLHPDVEIRRIVNADDEHEFRTGLFVKEDASTPLSKGDQVMNIPHDFMLHSDRTNNKDHNICFLAKTLAEERNLHRHNQSEYSEYMDFLEENALKKAKLPATWSMEANNYLTDVIDLHKLIAFDTYTFCFQTPEEEETEDSNSNDDSEDYNNMKDPNYWDENIEMALSRGMDSFMAPILELVDISNHPNKLNVILSRSRASEPAGWIVETLRDIQPGEKLSQGFASTVSTADFLGSYGYVAPYPQYWKFPQHQLGFIIMEEEPSAGRESDKQQYSVQWLSSIPDDDGFLFLTEQNNHATELREELRMTLAGEKISEELEKMSLYEIKTIYHLLDAKITAVTVAINAAEKERPEGESEHFIQEERYVIDNLDAERYLIYQCMTLVIMFQMDAFDSLEIKKSTYQTIEYKRDPKTNDICFFLDRVFQMCWSYWPHYHEPEVHKLAKYVPTNIKRVLWVGGGDSGLLNEVLKYPSLELVVGLELDQQVTRLAFKHFASRPHYDNPKVQWWYGDASKTLLMLPEEYFGSFDMVLVDLSDTLFSLTVSKELDVIETLSLLLRPGGVFSMNELFFKRVSDVFEYTIHYTYQDVPRVCDQSFIIASNDVDFLNQQLTHHKLDENATLFVENSSHKTLSQFDKVHDFRRNPHSAFQRLCKKDGDLDQTEEKPQIEAPGILMILEAENLTVDLDSTENIRIAMLDALERQGMQVLSNNVPSKSSSFTIVFSEGYLVARVWSKFNYVAVDLHLWSAFDKHDTLKTSIVVEALGGDLNNQSTTSYRIVAAGMYGLPTWKADRDMNGPKVSRACGTNDVVRDSPSDIDIFKLALETSLDVVQGRDLVIAVICDVGEESCPSLDVLTSHEKVKQVIPLHPCPTLAGDESEQHKCSMEGVELYLEEILPEDDDLIDAIIFDWDSPFSMHLSIDIMLEEDHLDIDNLFVFGVVDSKHDLWRRGAIDRLRHSIVVMDPVFRAHVLLNTTASSLEVALVSTGDLYFIENLSNAVTAVDRKREGVSSEVRNIIGGKWREDRKATSEDWEASIFMTEKDYDTSDALTQLRTQFPVATQSVSQFTHMSSLKPGEKVLIKNEDEYLATPWWVEGDVLSVNDDGTYEIQFTLDDIEDGFTRETIKRVGKDSDPPEIVPKEQLLEACRYAFYMRPEAEMNIYDDIGGSGLVCTGVWEKGEAIILWDGRYQVDINIWSIKDMDEVDDFEKSVLRKLPNLVQKLRDIQPRGFGRVVNFKDDVFRGKREGERLSEED